MNKLKQLFIATKRGNKHYYIARLSDDASSLILQRVTRECDNFTKENDPKSFHTVATFIDCDDYVFSAIEIGEKQYDIASKVPSSEYNEDELNAPEKYRQYCVECTTPKNNVLRVHLNDYDEKADVFNSFVITIEKDGVELVTASAEVDKYDEMSIVLYGCPAGFEVEEF